MNKKNNFLNIIFFFSTVAFCSCYSGELSDSAGSQEEKLLASLIYGDLDGSGDPESLIGKRGKPEGFVDSEDYEWAQGDEAPAREDLFNGGEAFGFDLGLGMYGAEGSLDVEGSDYPEGLLGKIDQQYDEPEEAILPEGRNLDLDEFEEPATKRARVESAKDLSAGLPEEHKCDFPGCSRVFKTARGYAGHKKVHNRETEDLSEYFQSDEGVHLGFGEPVADPLTVGAAAASATSYKCGRPGCDMAFDTFAALAGHMGVHDIQGPNQVNCPVCSRPISTNAMRRHMRIHTGEKPFECKECGWCFTTSSQLASHIFTHTKEKRHECKTCHGKFSKKSSLDEHVVRKHTLDFRFKCSEPGCGMGCATNQELLRHIAREHTLELRFKCGWEGCGMGYDRSSALKQHELTHTGERFKCGWEGCSEEYSRQSTLNNHIKKDHTKEFRFKCIVPGCEAGFVTKQAVDGHKERYGHDYERVL